MSFAELEKAIFAAATEQSEAARARLEKRIAQEQTRIQEQAREIEEAIIEAAHAEGKQRGQKIHQTAQLSARADILNAKQKELDATREAVTREILGWDAKKTEALIAALFDLLPDANGTVHAGEIHEEAVRKQAKKRDFTVAKKMLPGEGGFVFTNAKAEINVTIGRLVAQLFARHRAELARTLFE